MYTVNFGLVSKRRNSTYVPAAAELPLSLDVALKEPTSDTAPVFTLHKQDNTFNYNYCEWGGWYYWIMDVKRVRNELFDVSCKLDPLATYKANILATTAFVLYDTTANTEISDSRLSTKTTTTYVSADGGSSIFEVGNCAVLGIVGKSGTGLYALDLSDISDLMDSINHWMDDDDMIPVPDVQSLSDLDEAVFALAHNVSVGFRQLIATGKAPDCIKSAMVIPISGSRFGGSSSRIYLGDFDTGINGSRLPLTARALETWSVSIPWQATDWRRNAPYHEIYLSLPYAGIIRIPPSAVIGVNSLSVATYVSVNGAVTHYVSAGGRSMFKVGGNCGSNLLIGASNVNPLNAVSGIAAGVGAGLAVAAAATPISAIGAGAAGIAGMINGIETLPSSVGSSGGGAYTSGYIPTCYTIFHNTVVEPSSVTQSIGTPAMAQKTLGSLTGFVQTRGVSVSAPAERGVLDEINAALDGGCFIE